MSFSFVAATISLDWAQRRPMNSGEATKSFKNLTHKRCTSQMRYFWASKLPRCIAG